MKTISSAIILAGLVSTSPLPRGTQSSAGPYEISGFSASKGHLSGYCSYDFYVLAPALLKPAHCSAYVDAGFSGATWLASVSAGSCDNSTVSWTFYQPTTGGGGATFNVTVAGIKGMYKVPAEDITIRLNDEPNPFDNDVAYTGPQVFKIVNFE